MKKSYLGVWVAGMAALVVGVIVYYLESKRDIPKIKAKSLPKPDKESTDKIQEFANLIPDGHKFTSLFEKLVDDMYIGKLENANKDETHIIWRCEYAGRCILLMCEAGIKYLRKLDLKNCEIGMLETFEVLRQIVNELEDSEVSIVPLTLNDSKILFNNEYVDTLGKYFAYKNVVNNTYNLLDLFLDGLNNDEFKQLAQPAENQMAI